MSGRAIRLRSGDVDVDERPDGTRIVRNRERLGPYPQRLTDVLERWENVTPSRVFLAERTHDEDPDPRAVLGARRETRVR